MPALSGFSSILPDLFRSRSKSGKAHPSSLSRHGSLHEDPAHPPVLILHGVKDTTFPIADTELFAANSAGPVKLVKLNCGHGDLGAARPLLLKNIQQFIARSDYGN